MNAPAVLIAKVGLDGHDRGALVVVRGLREEGFAVHYSGLRRSPEEIAEQAVRLGVQCVGVSSLSGGHLTWIPETAAALERAGWRGLLIAGGIIPDADIPALRAAGVQAVFPPHTLVSEVAGLLRRMLSPDYTLGDTGGNEVG